MGEFREFEMGGDDSHVKTGGKRWSGVKDKTDRFSFIWFPGLEEGKPDFSKSPRFVSAPTHYIKGVGYVVNDGAEFTKIAGEPPRTRVGTLVVVWPTDKDGTPLTGDLSKAEVQVLIVGGDKYKNLGQSNKNFPLGQHDVTVSCSDVTYQKLVFAPCKENLLVALIKKGDKAKPIVDKLIARAQELREGIADEVGRKMTIAQLREKMAGGDGRQSVTGAGAVHEGDIEAVMDDLLAD